MSTTTADTSQPLAKRLGPTPLPKALAFWGFGLLWCFGALQLNKIDHVWGPIMVGLATFVNFFCFIQGFNHFKHSLHRWLTLWQVHRHGLNPAIVRTQAGYVVIDPNKGMLVSNGHLVDFRTIRRIVCRSNWQAHKIEIHGCTRLPLAEGFRTRDELFQATEALLAAVHATGNTPHYELADAFNPAASTSRQG